MPTRVRSIWQRKPEPIPPPVVCRVEPKPLVNGEGIINVRFTAPQATMPDNSGVMSTVGITVRSLPGLTEQSVDSWSDFFSEEQLEPEESQGEMSIAAIVPKAPITKRTMTIDSETIVQWLTTNYDQVVHVKFVKPGHVLYNLYIDLGRLANKREWTNG